MSRYGLDLEYKVGDQPDGGRRDDHRRTLAACSTFTLDLVRRPRRCPRCRSTVDGPPVPRSRRQAARRASSTLPAGAAMSIVVNYGGTPQPIRGLWGEVRFEELTEGVLWLPGQPNGAASWFPCNDHPSSKASYRIQIRTENPYQAIANGEFKARRTRAARGPGPTNSLNRRRRYLITVQIGGVHTLSAAKGQRPDARRVARPGSSRISSTTSAGSRR